MLLKKLDTICEEIKWSLTDRKHSIDKSPQKATANKTLTNKDEAFDDTDDTAVKGEDKYPPKAYLKKFEKNKKTRSK